MRLEVDNVEEELGNWAKAEARRRGITFAQFFRTLLIDEQREIEEQLSQPADLSQATLRERFLEEVRQNFSQVRAARTVGIDMDTVRRWSSLPRDGKKFMAALQDAMIYWVDGVQQELVDIGAGRKKGDAQALGLILGAHHVAYGRAKMQMFLKLFDPFLKKFLGYLREELGPEAEPGIEKALARLNVDKAKRQADFA